MIAVNVAVGPTIVLHSGAIFDLLDPWSSDFAIEDIAHGLANTCRYAGQCRSFYSVAEHSLLVSQSVRSFEFEALMHDAAEAFIGDVTRPLKQLLPDYKRIEAKIQDAIFARFGLPGVVPEAVKQADLRVLAAEQAQLMPPGTADWAHAEGIEPATVSVRCLPPPEARRRFLVRFEELR